MVPFLARQLGRLGFLKILKLFCEIVKTFLMKCPQFILKSLQFLSLLYSAELKLSRLLSVVPRLSPLIQVKTLERYINCIVFR